MKSAITILFCLLAVNLFAQSSVTDYDGNEYPTVSIGTQLWTAVNLRSAHYADGSLIGNCCWYNNNPDTVRGKLYIWDAAMHNTTNESSQGACPDGWHVPADYEWIQLFDALGGTANCAFALKDTSTAFWDQPLIASNTSGFSIVGSGNGWSCFSYDLIGTHAEFWTSTEINADDAKNWSTNNQGAEMFRHYNQNKPNGFAVRCVKNTPEGIQSPKDEFNRLFNLQLSGNKLLTVTARKPDAGIHEYCLYSVEGKLMNIGSFTDRTVLNLMGFAKGMYFINITTKSGCYCTQFIN